MAMSAFVVEDDDEEERRRAEADPAEIGATSATTTRSDRIPVTAALLSAGPVRGDEGGSAVRFAEARERRIKSPTRGTSATGPKRHVKTVQRR
jgi:hypothetical protein